MVNITDVFAGVVTLKRVGRELHGPCPLCRAGRDRLCVWPDKGRAWCRRCNEGGSAEWWRWKLTGEPMGERRTRRASPPVARLNPIVIATGAGPSHSPMRRPAPDIIVTFAKPKPRSPVTAPRVAPQPAPGLDDLREAFEERAAILEYDGGLSRADAEREAARLTGWAHTRQCT